MSSIIGLDANAAPDTLKGAATLGEMIIEGSTETFVQDVIEASNAVPVLVDFWASWCGPCRTLGPLIEDIVTARKGAVKLVKIDSDANQQLSAQLGVRSLPTVFAFVGGQPVDGFMGALPRAQIIAFIDKVLSEHADKLTGAMDAGVPDLTDLLTSAAQALSSGDAGQAEALYGQAYGLDPSNLEALAGLGKTLLSLGQTDGAKELLDSLEEEARKDPQINSLAAMVRLAEEALGVADQLPALEAAAAKDDSDLQAKYDLAVARFATGQRDTGLTLLLDIIRADRDWNQDAARKKLLAYMEAFGAKDPFTIQARKALSAVLFS